MLPDTLLDCLPWNLLQLRPPWETPTYLAKGCWVTELQVIDLGQMNEITRKEGGWATDNSRVLGLCLVYPQCNV